MTSLSWTDVQPEKLVH